MPGDDRPKRTGQPVERYGDFVPSDQRKPTIRRTTRKSDQNEVTLQDIETSAAAGSRASENSGSNRSATTTVKKQVIATTAKQDIAKLEIDINDDNSTLKICELELKNLEKKVVALMEQVQPLDGQSEEAKLLKIELVKMTAEFNAEEFEVNKLRVRLDNKKANLEHSKQLIQNVAELKKLELEQEEIELEEAASQKLSDDDFNTASEEDDSEEAKSDDDEPQVKTVQKKVVRMKNPSFKTTSRKSKKAPPKTKPPSDPTTALGLVIASALSKASRSTTSTSNKYLSRQSMKQELPQFDGCVEEWPIFISQFKLVSTECKLTAAENLQRLQKALKGKARETVRALLMSEKNVDEVIETLEERFGTPKVIMESLINQARKVAQIKEGNHQGLLEFVDAVRNLATVAKSLNCQPYLSNPQLLQELVQKIPLSLQMWWGKKLVEEKKLFPDLEDFSKWLQEMARAVNQIHVPNSYKQPESKKEGKKRKEEKVWVAAEETNLDEKKKIVPCKFCNKINHKFDECRAFPRIDLEERWKFVKENRLCFNCLKPGHASTKCRGRKQCGLEGCNKRHHPTLHFQPAERRSESAQWGSRAEAGGSRNIESSPDDGWVITRKPEAVETVAHAQETHIGMQIVPVTLKGPRGTIKTLAMLDTGCTMTLVSEWVANKLGLEGPRKPFYFQSLHPTTRVAESRTVSIELIVEHDLGERVYQLDNVRTKESLPLPRQSVKKAHFTKWPHLQHLNIKCYEGVPTLLIGLDNRDLILSREYVSGPPNAPAAAKTALGWTLLRCRDDAFVTSEACHFFIGDQAEEELNQLVKHHFSLESIGVKTATKLRSKEDERAREILDATVQRRRNNHGWETGMLWKSDNVVMPKSSYTTALHRLYQMERRMDRDPEFAKAYETRIQEYLDKGFAKKLKPAVAVVHGPKTYYLPHFMAKNPKKPKKLRFVFDAASKSSNLSLNDFLLKGPDLLKPLPSVLFKFRQRSVGLTADIMDMFHRVHVKEEDVDAQRFLWRGSKRDIPPETYQMRVLIFGSSCSPVCAQEVKNKNAKEFEPLYPDASEAIIHRHYMDDYLDSCDSVEQAMTRFHQVLEVHKCGDFHIRNWISNSREVLSQIPNELIADGVKSMDIEEESKMERILGLFWKPEEDFFTFSLNFIRVKKEILSQEKAPTKREMLALVMSVFDPLGFLSHFIIKAKILLQDAWRMEIGWDDELPHRLIGKWKQWLNELENIPKFALPRCYSARFSTSKSTQLHVFVDASEQAYGAVCYFRIEDQGDVHIALVMAKARVAPLKPVSIPRMELQAAVIGVRLAKFIKDEHDIKYTRVVFWSDSSTVLSWLRGDGRRYQQFVATRIGEIQEESNIQDWRWIPTRENVADECTRDGCESQWSPESRWIKGPSFLLKNEEDWPQQKQPALQNDDEEKELKKEYVNVITNQPPLIDIGRYSTWTRAVRVVSFVFRIKNYCLMKSRRTKFATTLHPDDIKTAEAWWWKLSQNESFHEEMKLLQKNRAIPASSTLYKCCPFLDEEGVLRLGGRIENAKCVGDQTKFPVILHPQHQVTRLLLDHYHVQAGHHGQEKVVNEIRQKYHIIRLRAAVRSTWTRCQKCKIERAKPIVPQMGQLPVFRLEPTVRPFVVTGVDYFGPMEVAVGRRHEKRYGVLFTCMAIRAVHLEIAHSLTTDSCLMAIRRFVSRRGCPKEMWSDNGTNFRGADNELRELLQQIDQNKLTDELTFKGINWKFLPAAAPHMGGSWERLVRSVKVALYAALSQHYPTDEVLMTFMMEAEHSVNSHPLTHVPLDPEDPEALTPNHFLIGRSSNAAPWGQFEVGDLCLRKGWRKAQVLADHFWQRWVKEFIPTLLRRTKWFQRQNPIKIGDVVLEVHPNLPRNSWPMGRVVEVFPGKDYQVRAVSVKYATGVFRRAVARLCVLDVEQKRDDHQDDQTFRAQNEDGFRRPLQ